MNIYFNSNVFNDESHVREYISQLKGQDIASIDGLSLDFIREFKDKIDFDVLLHAYYVSYHLDEKIKKQFKGYDLR